MKIFKITKQVFVISVLFLAISSCNSNGKAETSKLTDKKQQVLNPEKLPTQKFTIDADRDTILKGTKGTTLRIYKNTFTDNNRKVVTGQIEIELKEAITKTDIILSGLTTTSNNELLETGGMIYLNAYINNQELQIANDKSIGTIFPNANIKKGMKLFEGTVDSGKVNWINPKEILNDKLIKENANAKQSNKSVSVDTNIEVQRKETRSEIDAILDYVESDSSLPKDKPVRKRKNDVAKKNEVIKNNNDNDIFLNEIQSEKGSNLFQEDYKTNYIFSIKKLGWANIDRLYSDPRLKEIEFITSIDKHSEFDKIYITLIIGNQNMFIPGYEKKDGTFSFTHDDFEKTQLPVGEKATILVTAYKNDKPFYSINSITISENFKINIRLEETTEDKLKQVLESKI